METMQFLVAWTPYLLGGLLENLRIAATAMVLGTVLGLILSFGRRSSSRLVQAPMDTVVHLLRTLPTLVLLFYLATLLPGTIELWEGAWVVVIPLWLKAALALSASPIGFTAWNAAAALAAWSEGDRHRAMLFIPNWSGAFIITLLTSSVASLIGVDELVNRANTVIRASGNHQMIPVYLYASLWFVLVASGISLLTAALRRRLLLWLVADKV